MLDRYIYKKAIRAEALIYPLTYLRAKNGVDSDAFLRIPPLV